MSSRPLFSIDLTTDAGLEELALVMYGLECSMGYPEIDPGLGGVRLWDSVVQGGGDIILPRLIRVETTSQRAGGGYLVEPDKPPGYYSGRLSVELTNRKTWKLSTRRPMVIAGSGPCVANVNVYGLVYVCASVTKPDAALPTTHYFVSEYLWEMSRRKLTTAWDWLVEQMEDERSALPHTTRAPV